MARQAAPHSTASICRMVGTRARRLRPTGTAAGACAAAASAMRAPGGGETARWHQSTPMVFLRIGITSDTGRCLDTTISALHIVPALMSMDGPVAEDQR